MSATSHENDSDVYPVIKEPVASESGIYNVTELDEEARRVYEEGNRQHDLLMEHLAQYESLAAYQVCADADCAIEFLRAWIAAKNGAY